MRFIRMPWFLKLLLRKGEWRLPANEKVIYLTFDDGPIPEVTDFVLNQLARYNAKATFFAVGDNVQKYPEILERVLAQGHQVGNHTFNHLNGWNTNVKWYLENVKKCEEVLDPLLPAAQPRFFRPPYGKLTLKQYNTLLPQYRLIFWDLLTYDFDGSFSPEACLKTSLAKTRPGSIVVFHDSLKARRNLEFVLPRYLESLSQAGYRFSAL